MKINENKLTTIYVKDTFKYSYLIKDKGIILDSISVCGAKDGKLTELKFSIWQGNTIVPVTEDKEYDSYVFMAHRLIKAKEIIIEPNDCGRIVINKKNSMHVYDLSAGESFDFIERIIKDNGEKNE